MKKNKLIVGANIAPRKKSAEKIRNLDDKTLIVYEFLADNFEIKAPFDASNTNQFLENANLGVEVELQNADGTTANVTRMVLELSNLDPNDLRKNCPIIREQHATREALKNLCKKMTNAQTSNMLLSMNMEDRKVAAAKYREVSKSYRLLNN